MSHHVVQLQLIIDQVNSVSGIGQCVLGIPESRGAVISLVQLSDALADRLIVLSHLSNLLETKEMV